VSGTSPMLRRQALIGIAAATLAGALAPSSKASLLGPLFAARPEPSLVFSYRGWRVDASAALKGQQPTATVRKLKTQIDIVEQAGLSPQVLAFMRTIPVTGTPPTTPDSGRYVPGKGVFIRAKGLDDKRPTLLRQLLYAYGRQQLPGGFANPTAEHLRAEAAAKHVWPKGATMLRSGADYFAMTASAYLCGAITSEPYTRADLKRTQPDAYQWLADVFDGGRPRA
jgi:hypothetical protein